MLRFCRILTNSDVQTLAGKTVGLFSWSANGGVCCWGLVRFMKGLWWEKTDRQAFRPPAWRHFPPHPLLALCHAPSSPPKLSLACQNQSRNALPSASPAPVWTGWHQISGAMCQGPYENRCPHYWVTGALDILQIPPLMGVRVSPKQGYIF